MFRRHCSDTDALLDALTTLLPTLPLDLNHRLRLLLAHKSGDIQRILSQLRSKCFDRPICDILVHHFSEDSALRLFASNTFDPRLLRGIETGIFSFCLSSGKGIRRGVSSVVPCVAGNSLLDF